MNRLFLLYAEFEQADIPVTSVGKKYFGLNEKQSKRKAAAQDFPFPVFRGGSQKSEWLVSVPSLAEWLNNEENAARKEWQAMQMAREQFE
jgi:hypothetical protein